MGTVLDLFQLEAGTAEDDLLLVFQVLVDDVAEGEDSGLGLVVYQGQHVDGKGGLELGLGKKAVQDHLGIGVPFQLDDDAHSVAVGFVPDIGDALQTFVLHLIRHVLDEHPLVDLIGNLGDDDAGAVLAELLELGAGTDLDVAPAGGVGLPDAGAAHDDALGGKIRALDVFHQVAEGGLRVLKDMDAGADDLTEVMGRDVGGHAYGDAHGTVYQKIGETAGQDAGLLAGFVKVGVPVYRVLIDVPEHLVGQLAQTGLGIAVGRGGVAVHRAEVAVAVYQQVAGGKILGQADQCVVDRLVAVGVVAAQDVAHAGGGLFEGLVTGQVVLVHGVEDAAVDGLEAVTDVGQGAALDDGHGVLDEGLLHLRHQRGRGYLLIRVADFFRIVLGFF